jgi:hypothetical protein
MAWLRAVAGFQVFRGGRFSVFGDRSTSAEKPDRHQPKQVIDIRRNT